MPSSLGSGRKSSESALQPVPRALLCSSSLLLSSLELRDAKICEPQIRTLPPASSRLAWKHLAHPDQSNECGCKIQLLVLKAFSSFDRAVLAFKDGHNTRARELEPSVPESPESVFCLTQGGARVCSGGTHPPLRTTASAVARPRQPNVNPA